MIRLPRARRVLLACALMLLGGCAKVPAWDRGNLAKPQAAFDPEPADSAMRQHVYSSRESGASGPVGAGGGCGCY